MYQQPYGPGGLVALSKTFSYRVLLSKDIKRRSYRCIHLLSLDTDRYEGIKQATLASIKLVLEFDRLDLYLLFQDFPRDWFKGDEPVHFMLSVEDRNLLMDARRHLGAILKREIRRNEIVAAGLYLMSTIPDPRIDND